MRGDNGVVCRNSKEMVDLIRKVKKDLKDLGFNVNSVEVTSIFSKILYNNDVISQIKVNPFMTNRLLKGKRIKVGR